MNLQNSSKICPKISNNRKNRARKKIRVWCGHEVENNKAYKEIPKESNRCFDH